MLRNLKSYKGFDFLISPKKLSLISSDFYIKDDFHICVLKFRKGHESDRPVCLLTTPCRISGLSTFIGKKIDYLNVPDLLLYLF